MTKLCSKKKEIPAITALLTWGYSSYCIQLPLPIFESTDHIPWLSLTIVAFVYYNIEKKVKPVD